MYKNQPWPLEGKKSKKASKKDVKKEAKKRFYSADIAVSTARVLKLFEDNKERIYTNREIAQELGLSESTVTGINTRLEGVRKIKIVEVLQRVSAYTPLYQHINGSCNRVNKRRGKDGNQKDVAQVVYDLFENDKNAVYTKPEIIEKLSNYSKGQIEESLKILLLDGDLKLVGTDENNRAVYQNIKGNRKGKKVETEHTEGYFTVCDFLKLAAFTGDKNNFEKNLSENYQLVYSTIGIRKEYSREDLEKALAKCYKKKSFFERVMGR